MQSETEQIWDKLINHKPRKFTDAIQSRLESKMALAELFCSEFSDYDRKRTRNGVKA